ncbi:MAG: Nudix family hydrolase [Lautropia sp.]
MSGAPAARAPTDVAVGVVIDAQGRVLLGQRVEGKPYAGWWEFPGGKFERGEDAHAALVRELDEELGITVTFSTPWVVRCHRYAHADVRLHFRRVVGWRGVPHGREGQAFVWRAPHAIDVAPLLPASLAPIAWLQLPQQLWISQATAMGIEAFVARVREKVDALVSDPSIDAAQRPLLVLREPGMEAHAFAALLDATLAAITPAGAAAPALRVLVSSRHPQACWERAGGVHLTAQDLARTQVRPTVRLVGASCHRPGELVFADRVGADYAVYGPVLPTASHPGAPGIGWHRFADEVKESGVPVYALGGVDASDVERATTLGAQGVGMIGAAWRA